MLNSQACNILNFVVKTGQQSCVRWPTLLNWRKSPGAGGFFIEIRMIQSQENAGAVRIKKWEIPVIL